MKTGKQPLNKTALPPPDFRVKNCEIILNEDCNAKCVFCYQPGLAHKARRMSFEKIAGALYQGRKAGAWVAYLIGGEITLRPDLPKIIRLARKLGYPCVHVMSNGLKLAEYAYASELVEAGADLFTISVHGYGEDLHDRLVGVPGAHRRVFSAFENLKKLGAGVRVNNALNRLNYMTTGLLVKTLLSRFAIDDINIIFPHYSGMMAKNAATLSVSVTEARPQVRKVLEEIRRSGLPMEGPLLINFCPCNFPEAAHLMGEWARPADPANDEGLYHLDGGRDLVFAMKERIRTKNAACRKCVYDGVCMGFEQWYDGLFGGAEFKPVLRAARPFPVELSHARLNKYFGLLKGK